MHLPKLQIKSKMTSYKLLTIKLKWTQIITTNGRENKWINKNEIKKK